MHGHQTPVLPVTLSARDVTFSYGKTEILKRVSAAISPGKLTALVGPNGSGKSTLLAALARFLSPSSGSVELDGRPILSQPTKAVARRLAILPQSPPLPEGITVFELVSRGRYPHSGLLGLWSAADLAAIDTAMGMTGVRDFADRPVSGLSGGQRQRCWIAMALAQETPVLLLDEPTSALDLRYQLEILVLLKTLSAQHGRTIVVALHDLNLAASHADHMIFFREGVVHGAGATRDVCTATMIEAVFDVAIDVLVDPASGRQVFVPKLPDVGEGGRHG